MNNIYNLEDIPDPKQEPEFWSMLNNPNFKQVVNFIILNELRKYNPETLNDAQCRTELAKLKAYQELIDLPQGLMISSKEDPLVLNPEIPFAE